MDSDTPEQFLEAITFFAEKKHDFWQSRYKVILWASERPGKNVPVFSFGTKKVRTPQLNRVRSPSSGGVRQCFCMENVGMLVKFHLHPTRAETDAPPRRYLKGGGFFLKWPNHGTEFSARALKSNAKLFWKVKTHHLKSEVRPSPRYEFFYVKKLTPTQIHLTSSIFGVWSNFWYLEIRTARELFISGVFCTLWSLFEYLHDRYNSVGRSKHDQNRSKTETSV